MLVLSRKLGERVVVPDCALAITIKAIEGNRVSLGISAPADLAIYREELWLEISRQRQAASARELQLPQSRD